MPHGLIGGEQLTTMRYGGDGFDFVASVSVWMAHQAYRTHPREMVGSSIMKLGNTIIAVDGHLDNYNEIASACSLQGSIQGDPAIVYEAYKRWGPDCFRHLTGDWAIALWDQNICALFLARDHAGSRPLYYKHSGTRLVWSSYLEYILAFEGEPDLDQSYIAKYISCKDTGEATPFKAIRTVPPAHYVQLIDDRLSIHNHWPLIPETSLHYRREADYDENFIHLLEQSVSRRFLACPDYRLIAELSGGRDSSSVVCVADKLMKQDQRPLADFETLSYFDDNEPDWNEKPYFTVVERHRHRAGIHIDCSGVSPSFEPLVLGVC